MAETVEKIKKLLRAHRLRQPQRVPGKGPPEGVEHLAPKHHHNHACREQKPVAHGLPGPVRSQPPAGHQAVPGG